MSPSVIECHPPGDARILREYQIKNVNKATTFERRRERFKNTRRILIVDVMKKAVEKNEVECAPRRTIGSGISHQKTVSEAALRVVDVTGVDVESEGL